MCRLAPGLDRGLDVGPARAGSNPLPNQDRVAMVWTRVAQPPRVRVKGELEQTLAAAARRRRRSSFRRKKKPTSRSGLEPFVSAASTAAPTKFLTIQRHQNEAPIILYILAGLEFQDDGSTYAKTGSDRRRRQGRRWSGGWQGHRLLAEAWGAGDCGRSCQGPSGLAADHGAAAEDQGAAIHVKEAATVWAFGCNGL
ncbi:hypothetical protein GQ457_18G008290 [Hibiscus cannabinus]